MMMFMSMLFFVMSCLKIELPVGLPSYDVHDDAHVEVVLHVVTPSLRVDVLSDSLPDDGSNVDAALHVVRVHVNHVVIGDLFA